MTRPCVLYWSAVGLTQVKLSQCKGNVYNTDADSIVSPNQEQTAARNTIHQPYSKILSPNSLIGIQIDIKSNTTSKFTIIYKTEHKDKHEATNMVRD